MKQNLAIAKRSRLICAFLFTAVFINCADGGGHPNAGRDPSGNPNILGRISMTFNNGDEVVVELFDSPLSRDFLSLLPLELSFRDYASIEKIAYLPRRLTGEGSNNSGDFSYYPPWGNLAVFYKGTAPVTVLIMGRIVSGKEKLAAMNTDFNARIETK